MVAKDSVIDEIEVILGGAREVLLLKKSNFRGSIGALSEAKLIQLRTLLGLIPPEVQTKEFGGWVFRAREALSMKQTELASLVQVNRSQICKLESGGAGLGKDKSEELRFALIEKLRLENLI